MLRFFCDVTKIDQSAITQRVMTPFFDAFESFFLSLLIPVLCFFIFSVFVLYVVCRVRGKSFFKVLFSRDR